MLRRVLELTHRLYRDQDREMANQGGVAPDPPADIQPPFLPIIRVRARIPMDVLLEIFRYLIPAYGSDLQNVDTTGSDLPTLMSVCVEWRVAISRTRSMWTHVRPHLWHPAVLPSFLARSGDLPLDIVIDFRNSQPSKTSKALRKHAQRIKRLSVIMSTDHMSHKYIAKISAFLRATLTADAPLLAETNVWLYNMRKRVPVDVDLVKVFDSVPLSSRKLYLVDGARWSAGPIPNLTELYILCSREQMDFAEDYESGSIFQLLSFNASLRKLVATDLRCREMNLRANRIDLTHVKSLDIAGSSWQIQSFLSSVAVPATAKIQFRSEDKEVTSRRDLPVAPVDPEGRAMLGCLDLRETLPPDLSFLKPFREIASLSLGVADGRIILEGCSLRGRRQVSMQVFPVPFHEATYSHQVPSMREITALRIDAGKLAFTPAAWFSLLASFPRLDDLRVDGLPQAELFRGLAWPSAMSLPCQTLRTVQLHLTEAGIPLRMPAALLGCVRHRFVCKVGFKRILIVRPRHLDPVQHDVLRELLPLLRPWVVEARIIMSSEYVEA